MLSRQTLHARLETSVSTGQRTRPAAPAWASQAKDKEETVKRPAAHPDPPSRIVPRCRRRRSWGRARDVRRRPGLNTAKIEAVGVLFQKLPWHSVTHTHAGKTTTGQEKHAESEGRRRRDAAGGEVLGGCKGAVVVVVHHRVDASLAAFCLFRARRLFSCSLLPPAG